MRPSTSLVPQKAISQNQLNSPLFPYLKPIAQTVLQSLWKVPKLPSSCSSFLLQDLGYIVISLCVIVQKSTCHVTLDHGEVQERHKFQVSRQSLGLQGSRSVSRKAGSLMAAVAGMITAAACHSFPYYTRPHG